MKYYIDAGDMAQGTGLVLWECNGLPEQKWGYDSSMSTIYLAVDDSDASMCMDALGGNPIAGTTLGAWGCNGQASQQWLVQWYGDGVETASSQRQETPDLESARDSVV